MFSSEAAHQLIQAYIAYLPSSKRALLNSPCYSEYERELDKIGAHIVEYNLDYHANFKIDVDEVIRMIREESIDLYVLTNPNNPTGSILTRGGHRADLRRTDALNSVDETYIEFTDRAVYSTQPPWLPKERISSWCRARANSSPPRAYSWVTAHDRQWRCKNTLGNPLYVGNQCSGEIMGRIMFSDENYRAKTYHLVQEEKEKLCAGLEAIDSLKVFPSYGNFVLVKIKDRSHTAKNCECAYRRNSLFASCASFQFRFPLLQILHPGPDNQTTPCLGKPETSLNNRHEKPAPYNEAGLFFLFQGNAFQCLYGF